MEFIQSLLVGVGPIILGGLVLIVLVGIISIIKSLWHVGGPNEILVFSGGKTKWPDGSHRGYRVVQGGGIRNPIFEKVARMNLSTMEVPISIRNAFSKGGIALNVDAIANVKISSDLAVVSNAIERFLSTDPNAVRRVAKETLEGHLRGVLARLTPEEVNEDRLKFAEELAIESENDLRKLGIHLDTLKIQHVSDDKHYLDSIGRGMIATVVRDAEMAESDAEREAELAEAANRTRANVAQAQAEQNVAGMRNELRRYKAEQESAVRSEEERTLASAREARARAEQKLQQVRSELEAIRLKVDQVLPAEAEQQAREYLARGDAAILRQRGVAMSEALKVMNDAWAEAGENALSIFILEDIDKILQAASVGVRKIKVDDLNIIDSGSGQVLSSYLASYPAMLKAVLDAVADTTGIDVTRALAGNTSLGGQVEPSALSTPKITSEVQD